MTVEMLGIEVPATQIAPPRISLLTSAEVVETSEAEAAAGAESSRWLGGISMWPERCAPTPTDYWWNCEPDGAGPGEAFGDGDDFVKSDSGADSELIPENVAYMPYTIWTALGCSAAQAGGVEIADRARRQMEGWQSHLIARELWTGVVAQAGGFPNRFLLDGATELTGVGQTPIACLGEMEQALGAAQPGQVGMIHAQRRVVSQWLSNGDVHAEANGRRLRTTFGTIVVPDTGYPGTDGDSGDTSDESHIIGTGLVRVFLGPIRRLITDAASADSRYLNAAELNRTNNEALVIFERQVAAVWDGCALFIERCNTEIESSVVNIS